MQRRLIARITGIILFCLCVGGIMLYINQTTPKAETTRPIIVTSFYPYTYLVETIAGEYMDVVQLVPAQVEPHEFEPTLKNMALVEEASLLVYNGEVDAWLQDSAEERIQNKKIVLKAEDIVPFRSHEEEGHAHEAGDNEPHEHKGLDPHIWLDPVRFVNVAEKLRDTLIAIDPAHGSSYETRGNALIQRLIEIDTAYREGLRTCRDRDIIVGHDAFGYVGERYGLTVHPVVGVSPEEEPSPQRLRELSLLAKEKNLSTIFFESTASPDTAETIAREAGIRTEVLRTIETVATDSETYESLMNSNLSVLRTALVCS